MCKSVERDDRKEMRRLVTAGKNYRVSCFEQIRQTEVTSDRAEAYVSPFSCPDTVRNAGLQKKS